VRFRSSKERLNPRLRAPQNQRMHIVRALVGVDHFEVDEVARHAELVADAVAAHHCLASSHFDPALCGPI
jgi:hypothetical protein